MKNTKNNSLHNQAYRIMHSYTGYKIHLKSIYDFFNDVSRIHPECTSVCGCHAYIHEWLQYRKEKGCSDYMLRINICMLCSLYALAPETFAEYTTHVHS